MSNPFLQQQPPTQNFDVTRLQSQYQDFLRNIPSNTNPQQMINNLVNSGQVSQGLVNKAIQIANMFPGLL